VSRSIMAGMVVAVREMREAMSVVRRQSSADSSKLEVDRGR
jgi:hypothetical protein